MRGHQRERCAQCRQCLYIAMALDDGLDFHIRGLSVNSSSWRGTWTKSSAGGQGVGPQQFPPRRTRTVCRGDAMASAKKAKASAKLLLPEPFCPTRKVGLSNSTTSAGRLRKRFNISLRRKGLDMGFSPRCPFQLVCIEGRQTNCKITGRSLWLRSLTDFPYPAYIMPSVVAFDNGSCGQTVRSGYELKMMGDKSLGCQTSALAVPECPAMQPCCSLSLGPVPKKPSTPTTTPLPQTPPTRIRHQPQLTRHRQRSAVLPRRTV